MTAFPSDAPYIRLDGLGDVQGFSSADAGVAYSFYRDTIGGTYRPLPSSAGTTCVDPAGGLEKDGEGCLSINPDGSPEESGISLATSGVTVTNRVISTGDTMTGSLTITNGNLSINATGALGTDIDVVQSTNLPDGGIRVRKPVTADEYYEQGWNTANLYEFRHVDPIGADTKIFELTDQRITSVLAPINPTDAANKDYVDSVGCVEADGGLLKDVGGCLAIKPNGTPDDSGVDLSTDGLLITNRVRLDGDTMQGALEIFNGNLAINTFGGGTDIDIIQSTAFPDGGIRVRSPLEVDDYYQQGWNTGGLYEFRYIDNIGADNTVFRLTDQRITALLFPSDGSDAANKDYVDAASCAEADGGLVKEVGGCLAIKPNGTPDDSGVGLSTDGLLITNRVKNTGDTMTGALNVFYGSLSLNMFAAASPDLDIIQSVALPTGGIRIRNPTDDTESYQQGWNVAGNYELAHNNGGFTKVFEVIDQRITSLIAPINPADAVNKAYVDTVAKTGTRLAVCEVGGGQTVTTTDNFDVGTVIGMGRVFVITSDEITLPANELFMLDATYDFTVSGPAKTYAWHTQGGVWPGYTYTKIGAAGRVNLAGDNIMRAVAEVAGPVVVTLRLLTGEPAVIASGQLTVLYLGQHV